MLEPFYSAARCEACGECLIRCPVMRMGGTAARDAVKRLAEGQWVNDVLNRCTGCMSCEAFCPNEAHPYGLLLDRYGERYLASGIPRVFANALPQRDGPNIWRSIERWLAPREKNDLKRWSLPPAGNTVLFLGCNQRLTPYIADTALFGNMEIFTDPDGCCGEFFLRLGLFEQARAKASALARRFRQLGIARVIAFCPACQNTMVNLAPGLLGVTFDVEVVGLVDWLARRVEGGLVSLSEGLHGSVTVQDPCHASGLGQRPVDEVRDLLRQTGLTVREMRTSGIEAECCGLGAALARYRLTDVVKTGLRRTRQARRTGAGRACAWCNGCYMTMNMFRLIDPLSPPVYHLVEVLQLASGEQPRRRMPVRAIQHLASAAEAAARDGFRFEKARL